jgi:hypothetical protein
MDILSYAMKRCCSILDMLVDISALIRSFLQDLRSLHNGEERPLPLSLPPLLILTSWLGEGEGTCRGREGEGGRGGGRG